MSSLLSVRLDSGLKKKLEKLAKASKRSKSFMAAEAIEAYVEAEAWQLQEIEAAEKEMDAGKGIPHDEVKAWLESWGKPEETKAPRSR